jgi:CRP-like cAMP-binding protein
MAQNPNTGSGSDVLGAIENRGRETAFAEQIFALVGRSQFFAEFTRDDIALLANYMRFYDARPGQAIIREGDAGDYMLMVISGEIDVSRKNSRGEAQHMASVTAGMTLGEMSMIDGEARFATCIARQATTFGVLSRASMNKIVLEHPGLAAKILVRLVAMLSQRLRHTSAMLLQYMR